MVLAAVVMAEAVWLVANRIGGNAGIDAAVRVVVGTAVGAAVYGALLLALQAPELAFVRRLIPTHNARPDADSR